MLIVLFVESWVDKEWISLVRDDDDDDDDEGVWMVKMR